MKSEVTACTSLPAFFNSSRAIAFGKRDQPGRILRIPVRRCRNLRACASVSVRGNKRLRLRRKMRTRPLAQLAKYLENRIGFTI